MNGNGISSFRAGLLDGDATTPNDIFFARDNNGLCGAGVKSGNFIPQSDSPPVEELYPPIKYECSSGYNNIPSVPSVWQPELVDTWMVPAGGSVESMLRFMHAGSSTHPVCIVYKKVQ